MELKRGSAINRTPQLNTAPSGLPPFGSLSKGPCLALAVVIGILLLMNKPALVPGAIAGLLVSLSTFYSIHLIVRIVTVSFVADNKSSEPSRKAHSQNQAMWRLAYYLLLDLAFLGLVMTGVYLVARHNIIPFMLLFTAQFSVSQILIVSAASRSMRAI